MKYYFVINPIAGKKTVQEPLAKSIEEFFAENGGEYEIYYTTARGDAKNFAQNIAKSGEKARIYACGGEGTAFEVLNGIVGFNNVALGVIPAGSANDFISYFSDKQLFLDIPSQIDGKEFDIDLIKVGENYAINSCSIGLDAMVANNMTIFKKWPFVSGKMSYVLAIFYTLFSKLSVTLNVSIDSGREVINKKSLFGVVANAPFYGGGFYPTPKAMPFDGVLNYSVISSVSRPRILSLLKKYREGTHVGLDICDIGECKNVVITADRTVPLNMDGEIFFVDRAEFEIAPKACKLILPSSIAAVWKEKIDANNILVGKGV